MVAQPQPYHGLIQQAIRASALPGPFILSHHSLNSQANITLLLAGSLSSLTASINQLTVVN